MDIGAGDGIPQLAGHFSQRAEAGSADTGDIDMHARIIVQRPFFLNRRRRPMLYNETHERQVGMKRRHRNLTFAIILVFVAGSFAAALYGLRHNNLRMNELRTAVFEADRQGDDKEIETALLELRRHILNRMNTNLQRQSSEGTEAPIQLPYKFYRDVLGEDYDRGIICGGSRERGILANGGKLVGWYRRIDCDGFDRRVLDDARRKCETEEFVISERLGCLISEVHGDPRTADTGYPDPILPSKDFYTYDFPSPFWSPDLAGFGLLVFGLSLAALVLRLLF